MHSTFDGGFSEWCDQEVENQRAYRETASARARAWNIKIIYLQYDAHQMSLGQVMRQLVVIWRRGYVMHSTLSSLTRYINTGDIILVSHSSPDLVRGVHSLHINKFRVG